MAIYNVTSFGILVVTDTAINTLYSGGIADNPIASFAIAAGSSSATIQQVVVSFYGNNTSSGNLVITSTGEFVNSLSNSGVIAGDALADQTIGGGMDTIFQGTGFRNILNFLSTGNLLISGTSAFNNDRTSAGNLVISGNTVVVRTLDFLSNGNLVIAGTTVQSTQWNQTSSGNLVITPIGEYINSLSSSSGIAGAALADQTIAGGKDTNYRPSQYQVQWVEPTSGNLVIVTNSVYPVTRNFTSVGNLLVNGSTVQNSTRQELTSGNLVVSGTTVAPITINISSSGNLTFTPVGFQASSTDSGSIAGSSIAEVPIAGVLDNNTVIVVVSYISGGTWYDGSVAYTTSAGNLLMSGNTVAVYVPAGAITTTGNLLISGTTVQSRTIAENTAGNLLISGTTVQSRTIAEDSTGNLVISGTTVQNRTIAENTAGNLVISGTSGFNNDYASAGNLLISGTTVQNRTISENTAGNLLMSGTTVAEFVPGGVITNGELIISGSTTTEITQSELSNGNLIITGNSVVAQTHAVVSDGNLIISGTTVAEYVPAGVSTNGELIISGSATVEFRPGPVIAKGGGGGGSPVYTTSWDALTPYFPDDRHILGYQEGNVTPGNLRVQGYSTITFVSGKQLLAPVQPGRKSLADFMRDVGQIKSVVSSTAPVNTQNKLMQQAISEDRLLLSGRLLDFNPIQDELDAELDM
jgi:hypothetical protein